MTATMTAAGREARPEKVAAIEEITARLNAADAVFITEYRGLTVSQITEIRASLRNAGGEMSVYKNTLVRFAVANAGIHGVDELLVGPTALTFASGDIAAVAKVLKAGAKANENLVIKGGVMSGAAIGAADVAALADLPSREQLLAMFAGALQAPLVRTAGLLQALPRNLKELCPVMERFGGEVLIRRVMVVAAVALAGRLVGLY